jgi:RNA polymerase sigma factor (sigma-70 family)
MRARRVRVMTPWHPPTRVGLRALGGCVAERDMEASAPPRPRGALRSPDRLRTSGDAELVRLVRLGHEPAFEQIYDRHHRGILSFSRHMLGSRDEAEDAVQHTFIAAYKDLRASDKPIHLKAWLYTIARNRCLSMLRARREQVSLDDVEPSTDGLAAEVQRRQDLQEMLRDLQRLPADQREALVLSELGALSHEEIAMTLGVRKEKIKALVFQARESLASSRQARNADCHEIQQQLSVLRGGSLRRTTLRRHVEECAACRAFKDEVQRQRAAMAIILPVVPSAGLKGGVLAGALSAGAAGGAAGGGALVAGGATGGGIGAKLIVGAVVVGGALGGGIMAVDELRTPPPSSADERRETQARILGFADAGRNYDQGRPADGSAGAVVGVLRERAGAVAEERTADLRRAAVVTRLASAKGEKTAAVVITIVSDAVGDLGGGGSPAEPAKGKAKGPKKAKKPKVSQGYGAKGKGNAFGRGREPAAGNGAKGTPGGANGAGPQGPRPKSSAPPAANGNGNGNAGGGNAKGRGRSQKAAPNGSGNGPAALPKAKKDTAGPQPKSALPAPAPPASGDDGKGKGNANGQERRNDRADEGGVEKTVRDVTEGAGSAVPKLDAGSGGTDEDKDKKRSVIAALLGFA